MTKFFLKVPITLMILAMLFFTGCPKSDPDFDITDGSWGVVITVNAENASYVYAFRGDLGSGDVYFRSEKRGTFSVNGATVQFSVTHYDEQNQPYVYAYNGTYSDYYHMAGTMNVTFPDNHKVNGTWTAER